MKRKMMDLRVFDGDPGAGELGDDGQHGDSKNSKGGNGGRASAGYSFEQAEEIANARASKAERAALASFFRQQGLKEDEVTEAIKDYKQKKAGSQPDVQAITQERDDALKELENMKHEKLLTEKGVKTDDLDYVLYKVSKLVDEKTDFAKAAAQFLHENPRYAGGSAYRVSSGTSNDNQGSGGSSNSTINDAIRNIARK